MKIKVAKWGTLIKYLKECTIMRCFHYKSAGWNQQKNEFVNVISLTLAQSDHNNSD